MTESQGFRYERKRLETFLSWPANAKVEAWKMAKAGLRYTGQVGDTVIYLYLYLRYTGQAGDTVSTCTFT